MKKIVSTVLLFSLLLFPSHVFASDLSGLDGLWGMVEDILSEEDESAGTSDNKSEEVLEFAGPLVEAEVDGQTITVHEDFLNLMNEYETFFDEYVDLMNEDEPDPLKLIDFLDQYVSIMENFEHLEDAELSDGDMAYYILVSARINAKLLTVK